MGDGLTYDPLQSNLRGSGRAVRFHFPLPVRGLWGFGVGRRAGLVQAESFSHLNHGLLELFRRLVINSAKIEAVYRVNPRLKFAPRSENFPFHGQTSSSMEDETLTHHSWLVYDCHIRVPKTWNSSSTGNI